MICLSFSSFFPTIFSEEVNQHFVFRFFQLVKKQYQKSKVQKKEQKSLDEKIFFQRRLKTIKNNNNNNN